jgi:hypothetical protein
VVINFTASDKLFKASSALVTYLSSGLVTLIPYARFKTVEAKALA